MRRSVIGKILHTRGWGDDVFLSVIFNACGARVIVPAGHRKWQNAPARRALNRTSQSSVFYIRDDPPAAVPLCIYISTYLLSWAFFLRFSSASSSPLFWWLLFVRAHCASHMKNHLHFETFQAEGGVSSSSSFTRSYIRGCMSWFGQEMYKDRGHDADFRGRRGAAIRACRAAAEWMNDFEKYVIFAIRSRFLISCIHTVGKTICAYVEMRVVGCRIFEYIFFKVSVIFFKY